MESDRLSKIPPYLFAELDKKKRELIAKGADLIAFFLIKLGK